MAHVGVFLELEKEGIHPDLIVGSSIGSVMGSVYAYKNEAAFVHDFARKFSSNRLALLLERYMTTDPHNFFSKLLSFFSFTAGFVHSYWNQGFLSYSLVKRAYQDVFGKDVLSSRTFNIEDCKIPFAALTADLNTGNAVILSHGDLAKAVFASSAMPGICKPLDWDHMLLLDGGVISLVPVLAAHLLGAKKIIAVDTETKIKASIYKNSIETIDTASSMRGYRWNMMETKMADIVLPLEGISEHSFYQFSHAGQCVEIGHRAIRSKMQEVKDLIAARPDNAKIRRRKELESFYPYVII